MNGQGLVRERQLLPSPRIPVSTLALSHASTRRATWLRLMAQVAIVVALLCLAIANIAVRATWSELEDGVLWKVRGEGVTAELVADDSPAARAGVRSGDVLIAVSGRAIRTDRDLVLSLIHI